jgi:hypothetical protein
MRRVISVLFVLLASASAAAQEEDHDGEEQMLARINAMRNAASLGTLTREPRLDAAARTHSADMAWSDTLDHVSPRTGDPGTRVRAAGITPGEMAENVALHTTTMDAHQSLLESDAHRANLMNPAYTHIGLSSIRGARGMYVTQVLANLTPASPPVVPAPMPVPGTPSPPVAPAPSVPSAPSLPPPAQLDPNVVAPPSPGGLPAPSVAPVPGAPGSAAAPIPQTATRSYGGTAGRIGGPGPTVGYWVWSNGRWWYYPVPPGAVAGQRLQPDPSVQGPPPGYGWNGPGPGTRVAPPPRPADPRGSPPFGWSPRRQYRRWYWSN